MNSIVVSFSDHYYSVFIARVPYKRKTWQFRGILIIHFQISLFPPHMHKGTFSA